MISFDFLTGDKTKERTPFGKPKIYFTCHPDDYDRVFPSDEVACFDKICGDILDKVDIDCAIFYALDREVPFTEEDIENALEGINFFVIAVSTRMLFSRDSSLQVYQVLDFAKKHNRYILPILMDVPTNDLLREYSKPENFGRLQYLDSHDSTKNVSYLQRLAGCFNEHLINTKKIEEIRSSFTSSIFLSYRKMDRRLAEDMMRFMHQTLGVFDVAVWYDEFLPIGENWRLNISRAMDDVKQKSNLFLLLVTPNVLEKVEGKDNFVTREECPEANKKEMKILPVEGVPTDYTELRSKLNFLPPLMSRNSDEFKNELSNAIYNGHIERRSLTTEQLCNIGLAYLYGIHVERNPNFGLQLLELSLENGDIRAAEYLLHLARDYKDNGNYYAAEDIYGKLSVFYTKNYGKYSQETVLLQLDYSTVQIAIGDTDKVKLALDTIDDILDNLPSNSEFRSSLYINKAKGYKSLGITKDAIRSLRLAEGCLDDIASQNGEASFDRMRIMITLGDIYFEEAQYEKALEIRSAVLKALEDFYCDDYRDVILMRGAIAETYDKMGEHENALMMQREILDIKRKSKYFGPESLSTLLTMSDVINGIWKTESDSGNYEEAFSLADEGIAISAINYPDMPVVELLFHTLSYGMLLNIVKNNDSYKAKIEKHMDKVLKLRKMTRRKDTYDTVTEDRTLAIVYSELGNIQGAITAFEQAYEAALKIKDDERIVGLAKELAGDILNHYFALYEECTKNHNIKMANTYLYKLYEYSIHFYGPFHFTTLEWQRRLNEVKSKKKKGKR